jgi:transposase
MRYVALDVHRDFCEVAIAEDGGTRSAGRVESRPAAITALGHSLAADDEVVMEATSNAFPIAALLRPHVARVVLANPKTVRGVIGDGAKTDRIDALAVDEATRVLRRRVARRAQLVRQRTREKNQVHAVLLRNLKAYAQSRDLFGAAGRRWLCEQDLPQDEREMVEGCLRQIDFLNEELALLDRALARLALASAEIRRLMTLPGVSFVTAAALLSAIGDVSRFPSAAQLVGYLGFDPRVRQSGLQAARHGRISKQGPGEVRHLLVEAAWHAARTTGPLRCFYERIAARRGSTVAVVAVARKLAVIAWHMLSREEDYAFARPSQTREKLRRLELLVGAERHPGKRAAVRIFAPREQHRREREVAAQAEMAYRRLVADWCARPKREAAARGRASSAAKATAARQDESPRACS